jgi:hypothetical protein
MLHGMDRLTEEIERAARMIAAFTGASYTEALEFITAWLARIGVEAAEPTPTARRGSPPSVAAMRAVHQGATVREIGPKGAARWALGRPNNPNPLPWQRGP